MSKTEEGVYLMIKTLRITGVAAVALAGVVLASVLGPVSLIHWGGQDDQQMEKIIAAPSAVERFREQYGDKTEVSQDTPPLVKQAELFKDIIDPRLPPAAGSKTTKTAAAGPRSPTVKPPASSPKFELVGTSCTSSDPQFSFAYIRLPDNTYQWVKAGSPVGHLVIREVKQGSITCWDGRNVIPMTVEAVPNRANQLEVNRTSPSSTPRKAPRAVGVKVIEDPAGQPQASDPPAFADAPDAKAQLNDEEQAALGNLFNKLKELNDQTDGNAVDQATASELIAEYKSSRVSPQETKRLETLGEKRNDDKDAAREEQKREFIRQLNLRRATKK